MRIAVPILAVLIGGVAWAAPQTTAQQPPAVTFKVDVNFVEIDATVLDASGVPVRDLTQSDFRVIEEGKPQTVTAFSRVDLPVERPDPPLFRSTPIEPDARSNREAFAGRVFLIVLDDLWTDFRRTARVRAAARRFVERFVGANDMVAVVTTGGRAAGSQEFTTSRARLLAAIDLFMGQKLPSSTLARIDDYYAQRSSGNPQPARDTLDPERSHKATNSLRSLKNLADYLGGIRGRRKAIVWIGEGIDYEMDNPFAARDAIAVRQEMNDVIAAATRSNVNIYGIDARGLGAGLDEQFDIRALPDDPGANLGISAIQDEVRRAQDSLRVASTETGGFAVVNQNDFDTAFGRIIQENSTYYVLGYRPTDGRLDGKFRDVEVQVPRPGVTVRARRGYTAPKVKPASSTPMGDAAASPELREAIGSPIPSNGVRFDVTVMPFMGKGSKASLALVLEIDPTSLKFVRTDTAYTDELEVVTVAVDEKGKLQDGGRDVAPLRLSEPTYQAVTRDGFRITRRLQVPPGRYQLRIGVRDVNTTAVGSLAYDVDVPDFTKGPLQMSGLAIASVDAERIRTANPDPAFKEVLPWHPTAARTFPRNDTLAVYADVYDNLKSPVHRVSIKTSVRDDTGIVVFHSEDERKSQDLGGATGAYSHVREIPLKGLAPGRYVVRVEAQTLLTNGGTATRESEFRVR